MLEVKRAVRQRSLPRAFALGAVLVIAVALLLTPPAPRAAAVVANDPDVIAQATLPAGFAETQIASGMSSPTTMAIAPDGRIFVSEQTGGLRVIKNGALLSPSVHNRLSRFTANGDIVVPGSEVVLLDLNNLSSATNHNGGSIHFGPDGKLYVAVGENANGANSQTLSNLLGKMLRLNSDGTAPSDNPFFSTATGINRAIWSMGLRNPFTFSFQPGTGRMFINDVGQSAWEEIDDGIAGSNYGWPTTEGVTNNPTFRSPLLAYGHGSSSTTGCAITGGAFYNPPVAQFPASYTGKYFYADYCSGWIRLFDPATLTATGFATGINSPVDLQVGADGSLYYLYRGSGAVNRVQYTASQMPSITTHPSNTTVTVGKPASFTVTASGTAPLTYQWQRNNANIGGATSPTYTIPATVMGDSGATFRCVVTNGFGNATSNAATLTVTANVAPTGAITLPTAGATYAGGDTISYAGTGTDPEDGTLPASAFTWRIDFQHDTHTHPFFPATTGSKSGSAVVPTSGETSANVWYRIYLTVTDSGGMTNTTFRDVLPRTSTITIASVRSGLQMTLDGQPITTPYSVLGVAGMIRGIGATSPQTLTGTPWTFVSWSDGGAITHSIATAASSATYTATFVAQIGVPANESVTPIGTSVSGGAAVTPIDPTPRAGDRVAGNPLPGQSGPRQELPRGVPPNARPADLAARDDGSDARSGRLPPRSAGSALGPLRRLVVRWQSAGTAGRRFWWDTTRGGALSRWLRALMSKRG
jgi:glucose/arabinose dehydrogenase